MMLREIFAVGRKATCKQLLYINQFYNQINFFITLNNGGNFDKCGGDLTCIQSNLYQCD